MTLSCLLSVGKLMEIKVNVDQKYSNFLNREPFLHA